MSFKPLHLVAESVARSAKRLHSQGGMSALAFSGFSHHFQDRLKAGCEFLPVDKLPSFYERVERILPGEEKADGLHGFAANPTHVSLRQFALGTALLHSTASFFRKESKRRAVVSAASVLVSAPSQASQATAIGLLHEARVTKAELQDFCAKVKGFNNLARAHFTSLGEAAQRAGKARKAVFYYNAAGHLSNGINMFHASLSSLARRMP